MGNSWAKMIATGMIWFAVTFIAGMALLRNIDINFPVLILGVLLMMAAAASSAAIWSGGKFSSAEADEKAKRRGSRVDRVLDSMSDRELNELRARLMADNDGETVSLDDLLRERASRR